MSKITINALIEAPISKVWDYYTSPIHITNWNFASDEWFCPSASNDLRVGGKYSARMEAKDGSFGFDFEGIYDEVFHGDKFTFTMADNRSVSVLFESLSVSTKVTVIFDAEEVNSLEMQQAGWQSILNNFKKYAEGVRD